MNVNIQLAAGRQSDGLPVVGINLTGPVTIGGPIEAIALLRFLKQHFPQEYDAVRMEIIVPNGDVNGQKT